MTSIIFDGVDLSKIPEEDCVAKNQSALEDIVAPADIPEFQKLPLSWPRNWPIPNGKYTLPNLSPLPYFFDFMKKQIKEDIGKVREYLRRNND